jgi:hypothetical protein
MGCHVRMSSGLTYIGPSAYNGEYTLGCVNFFGWMPQYSKVVMSNPKIKKVDLPKGTLIDGCFPHIDYADAYKTIIPDGLCPDVDAIAQSIFQTTPWWVELLMTLRNRIVSVIGLKTSEFENTATENVDLQPGSAIRGFHVFERTENEILLGLDDSHLDFRVSILMKTESDNRQVVLSTVVRFNNRVGRAYFIPVKQGHKIIVKTLLRRAIAAQASGVCKP